MCVAGAIKNFTSQLSHYKEGTSDRRCKELMSVIFFPFQKFLDLFYFMILITGDFVKKKKYY